MNDDDLIPVDEARRRVLELVAPLDAVTVAVAGALGLVAAADVTATVSLPRFTHAAMDGFAVAVADLAGASPTAPVTLRLSGSIAAGHAPPRLNRGSALRIATGAALPDGADAVIRVEDASIVEDGIVITAPVAAGHDVRRAGEDVAVGDVLIRRGDALGPTRLAALSALGAAEVAVHRRPYVAVVLTGDEVARPGDEVGASDVPDAVGPALCAWLDGTGAATSVSYVADGGDLTGELGRAAGGADLIVTVGGVSMGHRDSVRAAADDLALWGVALRPGKPLAAGHLDGVPWIGLPGHPPATLVTCALFAVPAVRRLLGQADPVAPDRSARLTAPAQARPGRTTLIPGALGRDDDGRATVTPVAHPRGMVAALARTDVWIVLGPETGEVRAGTEVAVHPVPPFGI